MLITCICHLSSPLRWISSPSCFRLFPLTPVVPCPLRSFLLFIIFAPSLTSSLFYLLCETQLSSKSKMKPSGGSLSSCSGTEDTVHIFWVWTFVLSKCLSTALAPLLKLNPQLRASPAPQRATGQRAAGAPNF